MRPVKCICNNSLTYRINAYTIIAMNMKYTWDETKRQSNQIKHGLDFMDADMVLSSPYLMEYESIRNGEPRSQAFAYVFDVLTVLTVVYLPGATPRIISFRRANHNEREIYHDWLANDFHDAG
ncbi:conserved hypothetical protein [Gammaproteobacteria bacterium]